VSAPVRIDRKAWTDPRIKLLAAALEWHRHRVIGALAEVWAHCTEEETETLRPEVIDAIAEQLGFGRAMVCAELADADNERIRVRGTRGRIEWLSDRRAAASKGGKQRASNRVANASQDPSNALANASETSSKALPNAKQTQDFFCPTSPAPSPSPSPAPSTKDLCEALPHVPLLAEGSTAPDPKPERGESKNAEAKAVALAVVAYLNKRAGRAFTAPEPTVKLIKARLAEGYTERDLRLVVWHRCEEWGADEKMAKYLQPSTLFRPGKFAEYLADAKQAHDGPEDAHDAAGEATPPVQYRQRNGGPTSAGELFAHLNYHDDDSGDDAAEGDA
jgi:uncharacterized phage protein (TIGR02220 family)